MSVNHYYNKIQQNYSKIKEFKKIQTQNFLGSKTNIMGRSVHSFYLIKAFDDFISPSSPRQVSLKKF